MNIDNIQALISKGLIAESWEIDPTKTFVQVGVFQPGNRQIGAGNANTYKSYAMSLDQIMSPGGMTTADNGLTVVGGTTVELGGTLIHDTQIDLAGFHQLFSNGAYPLLYLDPSKNWVGIGTNSPTALLDLVAVGSGTTGLRLRTASTQDAILGMSTNAALTDRLKLYVDNTLQTSNLYTRNSDTIFWNGNGLAQVKTLTLFTNTTAKFENYLYVGSNIILDGLDLTVYPLSIVSSRNDLTRFKLQNQGGTQTDIELANGGGGNAFYLQVLSTGEASFDNRTSGPLLFRNGGTTGMTFTSTGSLGIGVVPTYKLDVSSSSSSVFRTSAVGTFNTSIIQSDQYSASLSINAATAGPIGGYNTGLYLNSNGVARGSFNAESTTSVTTLESAGGYWLWLKNGATESIALGSGGNYISFITNTVTNMLIEGSTGNIAIGTALAPTARLHVKGVGATSATYALKVDSSGSPILYARNDGRVSVNGASNDSPITPDGAIFATQMSGYTFQHAGNNTWLFDNSVSMYTTISGTAGGIGTFSAHDFSIRTNDLIKIFIENATGNVGVNSTSPTSKLQVVGLPTYIDNTAATGAGLTAGAMYIRTGHGLDIVV